MNIRELTVNIFRSLEDKLREKNFLGLSKGINEIYHYTSPDGLKSIIQNKSLRFSDYKFLNDKSEIQLLPLLICKKIDKMENVGYILYFLKFCCMVLAEEDINKVNPDFVRKLNFITNKDISFFSNYNKEHGLTDTYIFSLTESADSLTMWNYYCKTFDKTGYNIGIDIGKLNTYFMGFRESGVYFRCSKVIYDERIQNEIAQTFIEVASELDRDESVNFYDMTTNAAIAAAFTGQLCLISPFIKSKEFSNEREIRFIMRATNDIGLKKTLRKENKDNEGKEYLKYIKEKFLINTGIFIPQAEVTIKDDEFNKCIKTINISPYCTELNKNGIENFLAANKLQEIKVKESQCPVRY